MELFTLAAFCLTLLICLIFDQPILLALAIGLVIFSLYALKKGFRPKEILAMYYNGIRTIKSILLTFLLIGILTASWRAAGTIPSIICYCSAFFLPSLFLTVCFLLNSFVSFLTGTSFGTAATIGVICATMGQAMGIPPMFMGASVLSGAFFGDRCSPLSTSALLVSELTDTDIFTNIKGMVKTALVPFVATCVIYTILGFTMPRSGSAMDITSLFQEEFLICPIALIPAAVVLILSIFRVNVKKTMLVSIVFSIPISLFVQKMNLAVLFHSMIWGYAAHNADLASMINGGGVLSMVRVTCIVCLSSAYSGIFQKTELLTAIKQKIRTISNITTPFAATLITSVLTGMIACNQTLSIMLTKQLCRDLVSDDLETDIQANSNLEHRNQKANETFALYLENSAVIVTPLIPWCIAGAVPLATVGAPTISIVFACYLYLVPLWQLIKR